MRRMLLFLVDVTHISSLRDSGKHRGSVFLPIFRPYGTLENIGDRCFLPTFRPYGTLENIGDRCFYPYFVPTGLWKTPGVGVSTHISSLRDSGKHRGSVFLPIFGPYGTLGNTGDRCFYPYFVPTGLWKIPGIGVSTHISSLRDYGKHLGPVFSTHIPSLTGLPKTILLDIFKKVRTILVPYSPNTIRSPKMGFLKTSTVLSS